jgi:hypothetical protein
MQLPDNAFAGLRDYPAARRLRLFILQLILPN